MTKILILDQKQIISNDYQQFWVHFNWFLSLFSNSRNISVTVQAKSTQNCTFGLKPYFLKNFPMVVWSPTKILY